MLRKGIYTSFTLKNNPVTNSLDKLPPILKMNLRRNLCTCNEVLKFDIINTIVDGATSVEEIKKTDLCHCGKWLL
jgi:NAD(P)H-nitrite reductase large subunit